MASRAINSAKTVRGQGELANPGQAFVVDIEQSDRLRFIDPRCGPHEDVENLELKFANDGNVDPERYNTEQQQKRDDVVQPAS